MDKEWATNRRRSFRDNRPVRKTLRREMAYFPDDLRMRVASQGSAKKIDFSSVIWAALHAYLPAPASGDVLPPARSGSFRRRGARPGLGREMSTSLTTFSRGSPLRV